MDLRQILDLFIAMAVLAVGLSIMSTSPIASACLIQFSILTVLEHDSKQFYSIIENYQKEISIIKAFLLVVALYLYI